MPKSGPDTGRITSHTEFVVHNLTLTLWYFPSPFLLKWKTSSFRYQVPLDPPSGSTLRKSSVSFFSPGDRWHRRLKRTCLLYSILAFLQWERKEPLRMGFRHWQAEGRVGGSEGMNSYTPLLDIWPSEWANEDTWAAWATGQDGFEFTKEPSFLPSGSK